jgi:tryptophanyl-tRNA synthetase
MEVLSGIQPSSSIHIGNYFGAIKQWLLLKDEKCCFFVADLHSLTSKTQNIYQQSLETLATYMACGIDPTVNKIFLQSDNFHHTYFHWFLSTITNIGELNRMVQMKDKIKTHNNIGILTYPILMAADILLYNPQFVPVGQDQYQHLELTRDLAQRLNKIMGQSIFKLPKPWNKNPLPLKIYDLNDGTKKMSKTNPNGCLFLTDSPADIIKKIKKAKTDAYPMPMVGESYDHRPEIKNLLTIYQCFSGESMETIIERYQGKQLSVFKEQLAQLAVAHMEPMGTKIKKLMEDPEKLKEIFRQGKQWAMEQSQPMVNLINKIFLQKEDVK